MSFSYLWQATTFPQAVFLVDLSSALIAHTWFRKNEPEDVVECLTRLVLFAIAPVTTAVITQPSNWMNGLLHFGLFISLLLCSIVFYRISSFHPLSKYPGPAICKLSKVWVAWLSHKGKLYQYYDRLHKQYGPIVRIGPNELSVVEAELIPHILGQQGMPRGPMWEGRAYISKKKMDRNENLIATRDTNVHAKLRKPWTRAFGPAALEDYEDSLVARGIELVEHLRGVCTNSENNLGHVDIADYINRWGFDFMGNITFGKSFGLLREGDKDGYLQSMEESASIPAVTQVIPWSSDVFRLISFWNKSFVKFAQFALEQAIERNSEVTGKKDLFYHLAANMNIDDDKPPLPMMIPNVVTAIVAGSDTASSVLACTIYYLLQHPDYLHRLQKELDAAFPPAEHPPIQLKELVNLELLNAIINEVLRLRPPVSTGLQRAPAQGSGGKLIGDMFIPEGTAVTISPYVMHRDSRYFSPNPDQFLPERWYHTSDKIITNRSAFIPFSYGPAGCVGKTLAMSELRYITAMLVYNFDFWFEDGYNPAQWDRDLVDYYVLIRGKLAVKLKPRNL